MLAFPAAVVVGLASQVVLIGWHRLRRSQNSHPVSRDSPHFDDFEWVRKWVTDDGPLVDGRDDIFGHVEVAARIVRRLRQGDDATIAIVGRQGSGKTSICQMVASALADDSGFLWVHVSLWPFSGAEAAVRGVLDAIVARVRSVTSVVHITGIADKYVQAIAASSSFGLLAPVLRSGDGPEEATVGISRVLEAAGVRLVIAVEDMDRFAATNRERELGPLRALLSTLDQSTSICVIVSDQSLASSFDVYKLARYVERPPALRPDVVAKVLCSVRTACRTSWPRPHVEPRATRDKRQLDSICDGVSGHRRAFGSERPLWPDEALSAIARTPRDLKSGLREAMGAWSALVGEIDFDCLLVASILKVHAPAVLAALDENIEDLRSDLSGGGSSMSGRGTAAHERPAATSILAAVSECSDSDAVKVLVSFLFPKLFPDATASLLEPPRIQGFEQSQPTDYWLRFLSQFVLSAGSDQAFLELLSDPSKHDALVQGLDSDGPRLYQFGLHDPAVPVGDLLARAARCDAAREPGPDADTFGYIRARRVQAVWWLAREKLPADHSVADAVQSSIKGLLNSSVPVVDDLVRFFVRKERDERGILDDDQRRVCADLLQAQLVQDFGGGEPAVDRLLVALRGANPFRLVSLINAAAGTSSTMEVGSAFEQWDAIAKTLLALSRRHPSTGVPILLAFVATWRDLPTGGQESTIDLQHAKTLFDLNDLATVVRGYQGPVPRSLQGALSAARTGLA